jgi:hypothetical protein
MTDRKILTQEQIDHQRWLDVEGSSNIERVAWDGSMYEEEDESMGVLYVQFEGGRIYAYEDVPRSLHKKLAEAINDPDASVGSFIASFVKNEFDTSRVEVGEPEEQDE